MLTTPLLLGWLNNVYKRVSVVSKQMLEMATIISIFRFSFIFSFKILDWKGLKTAMELLRASDMNLPSLLDIALPKTVKDLIKTLSNEKVYLIGGFVRDMILGIPSSDLDFIVVDKSTNSLGKELTKKFEGNYFVLDEATQTTRFVLKDEESQNYTFDFTPVKASDLEADFERRDFTINTIAIDLKEPGCFIDKFNGIKDLKEKKIRVVKLENLLDDPLRFLRAFRFGALLNGEIDPEITAFIKKKLNHFNESVSVERISTELWKIFDSDNSFKYIKQMSESGLLEKIFPELSPMRKVTPNSHHHLWLYDHSLELIKTFEENFHKIPDWAKDELNKSIAKLGALLHDVGKPATWEIKKVNGEEKHTFYGHDKVGAEITKNICERLKFSNAVTETLSKLVRYHLRPFQLSQNNEPITEKALYRFFRDLGNDTPLLLMLAFSDLHATLGPKITKDAVLNGEKLLLFLFDEYKKYQTHEVEKAKKPKLLDGNEIMELTGLKPSKKLGDIIKELDETIAVGEIKTKDEAIKWVKTKCLK